MVRSQMRSFVKSVSYVAAFSLLLSFPAAPKVAGQKQNEKRLNTAFENASKEFGIPRELLIAVAYAESHFDNHKGEPSQDNGYGLMHLVDNPQVQTLLAAAKLTGVPPEVLISQLPAITRYTPGTRPAPDITLQLRMWS